MCAPKPPFRIRPVLDIELTRSNSEKGQVQPLREPSERHGGPGNGHKRIGTAPTRHWNCSQLTSLPAPEERACGHREGRPTMQNGVTTAIASRGFFGTIEQH